MTGDVVRTGKYIEFRDAGKRGKNLTVDFEIWTTYADDKTNLGSIRWYSRWRKYAFFPNFNTLYEEDCLREIAAFIEEASDVRRRAS